MCANLLGQLLLTTRFKLYDDMACYANYSPNVYSNGYEDQLKTESPGVDGGTYIFPQVELDHHSLA